VRDVSPHALIAEHEIVAADHPLASEVGAQLLREGGNAVDAAVATAFALGVVRPYSAGLGGGGFMIVKRPGAAAVALDYRETAPTDAWPAAYLDESGRPVPGRTVRGGLAIGVPGELRGLAYALEKWGTKTLAEVLAPAIDLAESGFPVDAHTHKAMRALAEGLPDSRVYAEVARVYLKRGAQPYAIGETFKNPDLARTLRTISRTGADALYTGALSKTLLAGVRSHGGLVTAGDLRDYAPIEREPVRGRHGSRTVVGMPPPSSGGACMIEILQLIDGYESALLRGEPGDHLLVEAMKHAFADRAAWLGDPGDERVGRDVAKMIDRDRADALRRKIGPDATRPSTEYGLSAAPPDDSGTTHFSVIDADGMAVACTETINLTFGSWVVAPRLGFPMNDELDDFTIVAGAQNEFGLVQSDRNMITPGRRPLSSMSPTIVLEGDRVVAVAGASGGPRIITATLQALLRALDDGLPAADAVAAPRIHHQWSPDVVFVDEGITAARLHALMKRGHRLAAFRSDSGVCQMIVRRKGRLEGACDPRKGGRPAGR